MIFGANLNPLLKKHISGVVVFMTEKRFTPCCLAFILLVGVSCSSKPVDQPDLGKVTGIVTLDGSPLEGVLVQFSPEEGRGSQGLTNREGQYELGYLSDIKGAKIGNHKVRIVTPQEDDSDPDAPKVKEKVPVKYNSKSTLTAEVKAGDNQLHFQLSTE